MTSVAAKLWGAHACRVLVSVFYRNELRSERMDEPTKFATGSTPSPARYKRALPGSVNANAFTLIELLIVMSIIIVLAGLILATSGYVQKKGYRSRAEAEIAAMSAALENYKADNGAYFADTQTDKLFPQTHWISDPKNPNHNDEYFVAGGRLYSALSGNDAAQSPIAGQKSYFAFKPQMLDRSPNGNATYIRDPFGNAYGFSTAKASAPAGANGYNPTFDLWSTANTTIGDQTQWIKNW